MAFQVTTATRKIAKLSKRIRAVQGGTSASKTISILLYLIDKAQTDKKSTTTSIVSESFPHLKRGAMRDFLLIMEEHEYFDPDLWNKTDYVYTFETGSKIEFFSADQASKVRGPRRDRLFINEANNIPFQTFEQLEVRTNRFIFLDWNPVSEFWFYETVKDRSDCEHIILTYKDNEALDPSIVKSIEQRKERKDWWQVFGEGQLGELEGKIYNGWRIIDTVPHEARLERYGLDFGYTNDPTTIVAIYYYNGGYILDEIVYQVGMKNRDIADVFLNQPKANVIADSAEPKSIDEIKEQGVTILPATKGKDSVRHGINKVQQEKISVTKRSTNIIREYRNYLWETDKDGNVTQKPEHQYSHTMDAIRYALSQKVGNINRMETVFNNLQKQEMFDKYGNPIYS
jgi:phage terminase large subunit